MLRFVKSISSDMHIVITNNILILYTKYMHVSRCISIFSKIGLVDQSKPCAQIYSQKIASCTNLQLPMVILKKSGFSDMYHHKTYMYINFQQNRVCRSVKTVHTNLFAKKNGKLHKFATIPIVNFKKIISFRHASSCNVHVYQFSAKSGQYVDQSKLCTHIYLPKNCKLHKYATCT